jgi:tetratricopeptide (TPR) repeat protein
MKKTTTNEIAESCKGLPDVDLIRSLTLNRDDYSEDFRRAVRDEIRRRGLDFEKLRHTVRVQSGELSGECGLEEALRHARKEMQPWELRFFVNCLGQTLLVQKEAFWISVHFSSPEGTQKSYFLERQDELEALITGFVQLNDWQYTAKNEVFLETWHILEESDSPDYLHHLTLALAEKRIRCTVKQMEPSCQCANPFRLLVPGESVSEASGVLRGLGEERDRLYEEISRISDSQDADRELGLYNRLAVLAPKDPLVFYNRGVILFEQGRYAEATEDFSRAALGDAGNKELFSSSIEYIREISKKMPDDVNVLHTLAGLLMQAGEDPRGTVSLYRKILELHPDDAVAHLNLGYLSYQGGKDAEAAAHFRSYLERMPDAPDRGSIETLLEGLGKA